MSSPILNTVLDRQMTVSQVMDDAGLRSSPAEGRVRAQLWLPPVDIYETEHAFMVEADLPRVHLENVNIQFDRNVPTTSGTRAATLPSKNRASQLRVFSAERLSAGFSRSIMLPEHVDAERISAAFTDGVLSVTVPKSSAAVPRKLAISKGVAPHAINT